MMSTSCPPLPNPGRDYRERERIKRKALRWRAGLLELPASERLAVLVALSDLWDLTAAELASVPAPIRRCRGCGTTENLYARRTPEGGTLPQNICWECQREKSRQGQAERRENQAVKVGADLSTRICACGAEYPATRGWWCSPVCRQERIALACEGLAAAFREQAGRQKARAA